MTLLTGLYEGVFNTSLTGLKNVGKIIWGGGGGGLRLDETPNRRDPSTVYIKNICVHIIFQHIRIISSASHL